MHVDGQTLDGPRAVRPAELAHTMELVNDVFDPERRLMYERFPVLFADDNLPNCRIILDGAQPISHVACLVRDAVIGDPTVSTACVGAVATHSAYRGHRLASAILDDCDHWMRRRGVHLVIVSGSRGLYLRRGLRTVGERRTYHLTPEVAPLLLDPSLDVRPGGPETTDALAELYDQKPVRYVRSASDWEQWLRAARCENRPARPMIAWSRGQARAYVVHTLPQEGDLAGRRAAEWAGEPAHVAAILAHIATLPHVQQVDVELDVVEDPELARALDDAGLAFTPGRGGPTVKVLRPAALFDVLRPYLTGRARELTVQDAGEGARFSLGTQTLDLAVDEVARTFFGDPDGLLPEKLAAAGELGHTILENVPCPLPRYGYNYT